MYEISLVPDVKSVLLQKQKMRNLIIFICIIVAAACGGVILILLSITGGQTLQIGLQQNEINCRIDGKGDGCARYQDKGPAVMNVSNVGEILTIQDQMNNIGILNNQKVKFSRIFGILDVVLPTGDDSVTVSEITANIDESLLIFTATGHSKTKIGFRSLEAFKKTAKMTYFDYGSYMRPDESGEYVEIPSFCIEEKMISGRLYGIYSKGAPGCEAPLVEQTTTDSDDSTSEGESSDGSTESTSDEGLGEKTEEPKVQTKKEENQIEYIPILRTYKTSTEREEYKNGKDPYAKETDAGNTGKYYFESKCLVYSDDGSFDEESTLENCPVVNAEAGLTTEDARYGKSDANELVLNFSVNMYVDPRVFLSAHKNMQIIGPNRQNVTDSYVQIRNMFAEKASDGGETDGN